MQIRKTFVPVASILVIAAAVCTAPSLAVARGVDDKAPASKPRPDLAAKVYTNDDFGWRSAAPAPAADIQPGQTSGSVYVPGSSSANPSSANVSEAASAPALGPERDPQRYAAQIAQLEAQLSAVEEKEVRLRDFRASGSTQSQLTGLMLNAPCEGITTDNLITQLDAQGQEIAEQLDNLDDVARANGLTPGVIAQASASGQRQPSPAQQRAGSVIRYQQLSGELAETQAVTADMQQQAASQGINLIPPTPGQGGNMTTDLLSRLAARSDALQNEAASVEADALSLGVQPGDLR